METDILIAGGGLAGMTLGIALAQTGQRVTLIDAQPAHAHQNPDFDGRAYALALASQRMLAALGLWDDLAPHAEKLLDIKVSDGRPGEGMGPFFLHFDHAEIEEGPMGYIIEDRHLRRVLREHVPDRLTLRQDERIISQTVDGAGVTVTTDRGETLRAGLLIGADGRSSGTATRAGIKRMGWGYDQTALVCAIAHEKPHNGTAHQFFMPAGPLAILPLPENRSSIVWSETSTDAARLLELQDEQFLNHLRPRFGSFLGDISLAGRRFSYPLGLSLAQSFVAPRVALVADAAHGLHPIAGQGLNAGLRDIAALAETLTNAARRGEDIGSASVLARYQQWRRFDTASLALATDGFNKLFSNDNAALRTLRGIGMGVVQSLPKLRRGFIREAAGLTGDLPRLMQGSPL